MAGAFLRAAYRVLHEEGVPLAADDIVRRALSRGHLTSSGKTPEHTMRARLSDEIRKGGSASTYQRVGANRFSLREWGVRNDYVSRPFVKGIPNETTVCVSALATRRFSRDKLGYLSIDPEFVRFISDRENLTYVPRAIAEKDFSLRQIVAYVWLTTEDNRVLCYTRGKYSSADRTLLLGKRSVGFGGHVLQGDADGLFGQQDAGLTQAAIREISEELKGVSLTEVALRGTIWDDSSSEGQKHIGVVLSGYLPNFGFGRRELSINNLELLSHRELWDSYHNFEFWSQLLVRRFAENCAPNNKSRIVPTRRPKFIKHIALVGEIACGKSTISASLSDRLGYSTISASGCLAQILGHDASDEANRTEFQAKALRFIESGAGPKILAEAIAAKASGNVNVVNVIDGLRQQSTLRELRKLLPEMIVVYVDCPRDLAFENYKLRWPAATVFDFCRVREHAVEADIPNFRYNADAVLHNADDLHNTVDTLTQWLQ